MKFLVHRDRDVDLTIHEAIDRIEVDDIIEALDDFYQSRVTRYLIWDLNEGGDPDLTSEGMQRIINYSKDKDALRPNGKSAIVTNNDRYYGLSLVFQTFSEMAPDLPMVFRVFRTMEEAKRWLVSGA